MAASEYAYGEGHLATTVEQPKPTHVPAQLSGIAHGEGLDHGFMAPADCKPTPRDEQRDT